MRFGAGLPGAEFTSLAWLGTAGGASHRQGLYLCDFHDCVNTAFFGWKLFNSRQFREARRDFPES
jgi:hypothetical protein